MPRVSSRRNIVHSDIASAIPSNLRWNEYTLNQSHPIVVHINRYDRLIEPIWDVHTGFELGVILKGKVNRWHGRHLLALAPGQFWLCKAWEPHGLVVRSVPAEILVIILWPAGLAAAGITDQVDYLKFLRLPPDRMPQARTPGEKNRILSRVKDIIAAADSGGWENSKQYLLTRIFLAELLDKVLLESPAEETAAGEGESQRIAPALKLVHDNPFRRIGIEEAAGACRISPPLLVRLFRMMMGTTFGDYARKRRLAALIPELRAGEFKLDSLAKKYGFIDAAHLCRIFKSCYGISPSQYLRCPQSLKST